MTGFGALAVLYETFSPRPPGSVIGCGACATVAPLSRASSLRTVAAVGARPLVVAIRTMLFLSRKTTTASSAGSSSTTRSTTTSQGGAGPLHAEVTAAAAGDIPDNQVFLSYRNRRFSIKYPEGWAQTGTGARVTFRDKNNIVRVLLGSGASSRAAIAGAAITAPATSLRLPSGRTVRVVYRTVSAPNAVTGKRVTLTVDRYTITGKNGSLAIVDLGTPVGVDNVDAYRLMIESFRWR